jgi:hypothetical protein
VSKADTPQQALALARAFHDDHTEDLMFEGYDDNQPVNEIEISGRDGDELAVWYDNDLRLRLAASDLLDAVEAQTDAAQAVIDAWTEGDLAGAGDRGQRQPRRGRPARLTILPAAARRYNAAWLKTSFRRG